MHLIPLIGVTVLMIIGVLGRAWLQHRRHGCWGIALFRSRAPAQRLRDAFLVLLPVVLVGQSVALAVWPEAMSASMAVRPRPLPGSVALFGGGALMVRAQLDLGASWRVGIDERAAPGLVSRGLYRWSRNPIFAALLASLAGFVLLIPTWLSVVAFAGSVVGIRQQVLAEEAYLRRAYGADYLAYASRVGRFLPWIGRLAEGSGGPGDRPRGSVGAR